MFCISLRRRSATGLFFAAFWLSSGAFAGDAKQAELFNAQGLNYFEQGHFKVALGFFDSAIDANGGFGEAYYNAARSITMLSEKEPCSYSKHAALGKLYWALQKNPGLRTKIQEEPTFNSLRDKVPYQSLMGLMTDRDEDIAKVLENVTWYSGVTSDTQGPYYALDFQGDGSLKLFYFPKRRESSPADRQFLPGRFKRAGREVEVVLDPTPRDFPLHGLNGLRHFKLSMKQGRLEFPREVDMRWGFSDSDTNCAE